MITIRWLTPHSCPVGGSVRGSCRRSRCATTAAAAPDADAERQTNAQHGQAEHLDLDLLALDEAGLGRVMVRYQDGVIPDGLLGELTELGVTRGLEFPTIGTVAVTATPDVLERVLTDPRVEAFHQQRRISLDLYASREQIQAEEADQPRDYEQTVDGETVSRTRPGSTGAGVTVGVLDSGIEVNHLARSGSPGSRTGTRASRFGSWRWPRVWTTTTGSTSRPCGTSG